jgi:hypothetical protein
LFLTLICGNYVCSCFFPAIITCCLLLNILIIFGLDYHSLSVVLVSVTNVDKHEDICSLIYENIFYYYFPFLVLITKIPSCFHFLH